MVISLRPLLGLQQRALLLISFTMPSLAFGIFLDGKGHYAARGESRDNPSFRKGSSFQAIDQYFRLETEVRSGDQASFFTEFRIFDQPRQAYLGDRAQPDSCATIQENGSNSPYPSHQGSQSDCQGRYQDTLEPGYQRYEPKVHKAYVRYASDLCLLEVGRRGRQWGLGMIYDKGDDVFDTAASLYDGVTCDFNIQKSQTMGFSVGYDKIVESGVAIDPSLEDSRSYGPTNQQDDLEQFFFTIQLDDTNGGSNPVSKNIGIYFANIMSSGGQLKTDIKMADLYLDFYLEEWHLQQEILFRLGKSADPNFTRLGGGLAVDENGDVTRNNVNAIALAGRVEYKLDHSLGQSNPKDLSSGDVPYQGLFFEYAYAPGDEEGYLPLYDSAENNLRTDKKAKAVALNANFKPALILFNGRTSMNPLRVDGAFDPYRIMNARIFALGYQYRANDLGHFTAKLITASLNKSMPGEAKNLVDQTRSANPEFVAPIGYKDGNLGIELDLLYHNNQSQSFNWGGGLGIASPGAAWDIEVGNKPRTQYLTQAYLAFVF